MRKLAIVIPAFSMLLALSGCTKNEIKYGDFDVVNGNNSMLKINVVSPYRSNPTMNLSIDGNRVSSPITSRWPFPGGGYNTGGGSAPDYMGLTPGKHEFKLAIPKVGTVTDSIVLFTTIIGLSAGKFQSLHVSDTADKTTSMVLEDDRSIPDTGSVRYRFVNLIPNERAVDLYFGTTKLASSIRYKYDTVFTMKTPAAASTWYVRSSDSLVTAPVLAQYASSTTTIANRRVFTVFASGYSVFKSPDTRRPYVSFYLNW